MTNRSVMRVIGSVLVLVIFGFLGGCLKTRTQLGEGEERRPVQRQVVNQQQREAQERLLEAEFNEQFRELSGRMSELQYQMEQLQSRQGTNTNSSENRLEAYEEALKSLEQSVLRLTAEVQDLKKKDSVGGNRSQPVRSDYDKAEEAFGKKKWREAIVAYQDYRDKNPKGQHYGDATYKIGVAFQELGMKAEAKAFYEEVLDKFPDTSDARRADYRLKNLK